MTSEIQRRIEALCNGAKHLPLGGNIVAMGYGKALSVISECVCANCAHSEPMDWWPTSWGTPKLICHELPAGSYAEDDPWVEPDFFCAAFEKKETE